MGEGIVKTLIKRNMFCRLKSTASKKGRHSDNHKMGLVKTNKIASVYNLVGEAKKHQSNLHTMCDASPKVMLREQTSRLPLCKKRNLNQLPPANPSKTQTLSFAELPI